MVIWFGLVWFNRDQEAFALSSIGVGKSSAFV